MWMKRLSAAEFSDVVKQSPAGYYHCPDVDGNDTGFFKLLRPKPRPDRWVLRYKYGKKNLDGEMRLLQKEKITDMYNTCYEMHASEKPNCQLAKFTVCKEVKKGLAWQQQLECVNCHYKSTMFKLYDEVMSNSKGPKAAAPNIGLQVGLADCPISNEKARLLFLSTNTPPPSLPSMQQNANKVNDLLVKLNTSDMQNM